VQVGELMVIAAYAQIDPKVSRPKVRSAVHSVLDLGSAG
jgi:hypothetical protein